MRTLLHEIVHHLDVTILALEQSFHTQGFFRRESSLARQLLPESEASPKAKKARSGPDAPKRTRPARPVQLRLFDEEG